jgi:hypothetical protein
MKFLKTLMGSAITAFALTAGVGAQAGEINLTGAIGDFDTINGATYTAVEAQPTGSGYIDSFVRVRDANDSTVQGYNTRVAKTYQNDGSETFNHEITVGQIGFLDLNGADVDGGVVMRFLLDINQTGSDPFILLSEVQIFLSTTPNQSNEDALANGELAHLIDSALVYQMDSGIDGVLNGALLNYALNGGSGSGDMILDIPIEMFASAFAALNLDTEDLQNGAYLYLYSRFENNNDGYEEWTHFQGEPIGQPPCVPTPEFPCGPNFIPEPNSMLLFGLGLLGSALVARRGRRWDRS